MASLTIIDDLNELYDWLVCYMERAGPTQLYPKVLVDWVDFIVREAPSSIDRSFLLEQLAGQPAGVDANEDAEDDEGRLIAALLHSIGASPELRPCSQLLVEFVAHLLEFICHDHLCLEDAIQSGVTAAGLLRHGYLQDTRDEEGSWLVTTAKGEEELAVEIAIPWVGEALLQELVAQVPSATAHEPS